MTFTQMKFCQRHINVCIQNLFIYLNQKGARTSNKIWTSIFHVCKKMLLSQFSKLITNTFKSNLLSKRQKIESKSDWIEIRINPPAYLQWLRWTKFVKHKQINPYWLTIHYYSLAQNIDLNFSAFEDGF